jgi:hypothetical protein
MSSPAITASTQAPSNKTSSPACPPEEKKRENKCQQILDATLLNPDIPSWATSFGGEARAIKGMVKHHVPVPKGLAYALDATQMLTVFTTPHDLVSLVENSVNLVREKGKAARLDNALGMVADISSLGGNVSDFTQAFIDVESMPNPKSNWPSILNLSSSLLSSVFLIINGRGIHYCRKILKEIKENKEAPREKVIADLKKRRYYLDKQCGVNNDLFFKTVAKCLKGDKTVPFFEKAVNALKTRIKQKLSSRSLSITATLTLIVASIILFAATTIPLLIAGSCLLVVGYTCIIAKMALDLHAKRKFNAAMNSTVKQINASAA